MENKVLEVQKKQGRLEDAGDFPKVVLIDTISYCNLKCSMCVHKEMKREKGIMSWNLFTKIINEIAKVDKNVRVWMVFFGEALLLKRKKPTIFDMIAYAKREGLTDVETRTRSRYFLSNEMKVMTAMYRLGRYL